MIIKVTFQTELPEIGEPVTEGQILEWLEQELGLIYFPNQTNPLRHFPLQPSAIEFEEM